MQSGPRFTFDGMKYGKIRSLINELSECIHKNAAEALVGIFDRYYEQDWPACRQAMEVYFAFQDPDKLCHNDFGNFYYTDLMIWFDAFVKTKMGDEPEGSCAKIFYLKVVDQLIFRVPPIIEKETKYMN